MRLFLFFAGVATALASVSAPAVAQEGSDTIGTGLIYSIGGGVLAWRYDPDRWGHVPAASVRVARIRLEGIGFEGALTVGRSGAQVNIIPDAGLVFSTSSGGPILLLRGGASGYVLTGIRGGLYGGAGLIFPISEGVRIRADATARRFLSSNRAVYGIDLGVIWTSSR